MEKYKFTKNINDEVLDEAIKFRTDVADLYLGCSVSINNDESVDDDNIEIQFSQALTSYQHDQVTNIVNLIDDDYDLTIRKNIENNTMAMAMKFGNTFLAQFSANNIFREKSALQIESLMQKYPDLIHYALTGSINGLYYMLSNMVPDENISQEEIDEFKKRVEFFLANM